jgi:TfoX/Sxy family transcriptional regulator of competence genes
VTEEQWQDLVEDMVGGPVTLGTMFGSKGLRVGRKFFAVRWQEQLVLKLPADRVTALVSGGQGTPFEPMAGRTMNGWVVLAPDVEPTPPTAEARQYVEGLAS